MNPFERIAIVGAGAMGTLLGAVMLSRGVDVELADALPAVTEAIRRDGLRVSGTLELQVPAGATLLQEMEGQYDLLILLTKQTQNDAVFPLLRPHLREDGILLTMQNGRPEPAAAAVFGAERVMGCAVTWAATSLGPGRTCSTAESVNWHNTLGRTDGMITDRVSAAASLLSGVCATEVTENLEGVRWSKLLINSSFSGMSAALGCTFGEILEDDRMLQCAQYIARECIQTARAAGISMEPLAPGEDLDRLLYFREESDRHKTDIIYQRLFSATAEGRASMLQDLERGLPSEIRFINGEICRTAEEVGVQTPFCTAVVEIVRDIEAGLLRPCRDNLRRFPAGII